MGALVASLLAGSAVMAHDRGDFDHREPPRAARHDRFIDRDMHRPAPRVVYRAPARYGMYHRPAGFYEHSWRRGERLPVAFYQRSYVIANYRDCGAARCVKCNSPADEPTIARTVYWYSPWLFILLLLNIILFALIALLVRKKTTVIVPPEPAAVSRLSLRAGITLIDVTRFRGNVA